jgi:hypothetical protein
MVLYYLHERAWSAIRWDQQGQIAGQSNSASFRPLSPRHPRREINRERSAPEPELMLASSGEMLDLVYTNPFCPK